MRKSAFYIFFSLVLLSILTPFWVFEQQLFPYITSKAFYFRICIELALPFYLYLAVADKTLRPQLKNPLNIAIFGFLIINIISAFSGVNTSRSLWGNFERMGGVYYLGHLTLLAFYVQMLGQAGSQYLKRFLQAFIAVAILVTLNGLSGWLGGPVMVNDPSLPDRVSSTFGNPIFFSSFLIIPMFLAAYFAFQETKQSLKVAYWVATAVLLVGIYSSGTRGALLGLLVGLFFGGVCYIIFNTNKRVVKYGLGVLGAFVILVGLLFANNDKIPENSTLARLVNFRDSNTSARFIQWKVALTGYKERPILGVGAENYYIIANKYYDPEIYKYDASWFDKPHNFWIEVLTTNGIVGFLAYLSLVALSIYGLWRAFKTQLFRLEEFSVLVATQIAYQVQNLTVFDTVSASVAFFGFLGLTAYVWTSSKDSSHAEGISLAKSKLAMPVFGFSLAIVIYLIYASNIVSMQVSKRINFGNVFTNHDDIIAANYFNSALSLPYNLDPDESANRYTDFVSNVLVGKSEKNTDEFKIKQLEFANMAQRAVAEKTKNNPLVWMRVAVNEMNLAVVRNQDLDISRDSIEKAIALAPKRVELLQLWIQHDNFKQDWVHATQIAEQIHKLNPYSPKLQWQLAISYFLVDRIEEAVKMADEAIAAGYKNTEIQQFGWYIQYYQKKKDFAKVVPLLELAVVLEPNDLGLYYNLALAYAGIGDNDHAIALARQIMLSDPTQTANMEKFIKSLETK